jgi:hypothetical protein
LVPGGVAVQVLLLVLFVVAKAAKPANASGQVSHISGLNCTVLEDIFMDLRASAVAHWHTCGTKINDPRRIKRKAVREEKVETLRKTAL